MTTGLLLVGCGSATPQAGPAATSAPPLLPTPAACPVVPTAHFRWPAPVPADLPQPPTAVLGTVSTTPQGLTIVRFRTTTSLQQGVLFVVKEIQKAGFTLGRGDAEPAEADAPFGRGDLRGVYKMLVRDTCATDWLVAVTKARPTGNSPLLPRQTTASPSPLPFG
jgi:hypothetical protein